MKTKPLLAALLLLGSLAPALASGIYRDAGIKDGRIEIVRSDGQIEHPQKDKDKSLGGDQTGYADILISPNGEIVGWLSLYPNCCTSYDIPRELVLYRNSRVIKRFRGNEQAIFKWSFSRDGADVLYCQGPLHSSDYRHYELRHISDGRLLEEAEAGEGGPSTAIPQWAVDLARP